MPPHSLTNFVIQKYYENKSKFNGVYSRNNLAKIRHTSLLEYTNLFTPSEYKKNDKTILKYFQ